MKKIAFLMIYLYALLANTHVYSSVYACQDIIEEFYYLCVSSSCKALFQVSFKKDARRCSRRIVMMDIEQNIAAYLGHEIESSKAQLANGVYQLSINFNYASYRPAVELAKLKFEIDHQYRLNEDALFEPEYISKQLVELLKKDSEFVYLTFVGNLDEKEIADLKLVNKGKQYYGIVNYWFFLFIYWGSLVFCVLMTIYSINRFYFRYWLKSNIDIQSLVIQLFILVGATIEIIFNGYGLLEHKLWYGVILIPVIVLVMIAEVWLIIGEKLLRKNNSKAVSMRDS